MSDKELQAMREEWSSLAVGCPRAQDHMTLGDRVAYLIGSLMACSFLIACTVLALSCAWRLFKGW